MRFFYWVCFLLPIFAFSDRQFFYDEDRVRYELVQTNGRKSYNWLFLPGGPGMDSSYFHNLIDLLDLPGNVWLIDLPGSGTNAKGEDDFNRWFEIFPRVIQRFSNPVLVGHSFGGEFSLLFPELEQKLKGFVILHSSPSLWAEAAVDYAKQFNYPSFDDEIGAFAANPSVETFRAALNVCMPYYFPPEGMEAGKKFFADTSIHYQACLWWLQKATEMQFSATWIPEKVPTLIIGGKYDCMCPYTLFQNDPRFDRDNMTHLLIKNGGHFSWLDNPKAIQKAFAKFVRELSKKPSNFIPGAKVIEAPLQ